MIKIWGRANSANVQKPMWLIGELGLEHERVDVGGAFGALDTPEYLAMNPNATIPTMQHGDVILWESTAILRYLAEIYGDDALWPVDAAERARIDMWIDWCNTTWAPAVVGLFVTFVRTPRDARDPKSVQRVVDTASAVAMKAERRLKESAHLAAEHFTLADIAFGTFLLRYFTLEFQRPDTPALADYYQRMQQRPAFATHAMIDYDLLRVPGAERP